MFTQKISMDCTKEQYEKYLKDELLKMGYKESKLVWKYNKNIIVNNFSDNIGYLASLNPTWKNDNDRLYLGSFNAELSLALAAMTDSPFGGYGEYYTDGKYWLKVPFVASNTGFLTTATREEIIERFGGKEVEIKDDSSLNNQIGGNHYKDMPIQPIEFITKNNIPYMEGNIIKYICRHRNKNKAEDIKKIIHYCKLILEIEYNEK